MTVSLPLIDKQRDSRYLLAIAAVLPYLLLYLLPLGSHPLFVPDETRYAEIPREMLESGDWIVPHLNGLRYFEKPPFGYWANALSIAVFGENAFAVRFPGALAVGLTALLIFLFVRREFGDQRTALWSTLIYLTFTGVYIIGGLAVLDNLLVLFLTGGIMAYARALQEKDSGKAFGYSGVSGIFLGLGFLTKGFLALAIPVLVLVPWMFWQGFWRSCLVQSLWVLLGAFAVILPWSIMIYLREEDFWHYFFWVEHIQRFFADDAQHKEPFHFFLIYLPLLGIPWTSLLPAVIAGLRTKFGKGDKTPQTCLLWSWFVLTLLFFSASKGKLLTYILPCFPPLAILIALGLSRYLQREETRLFEFGMLLNVMFLLGVVITMLIKQYSDFSAPAFDRDETWKVISVLAVLIMGVIGGLTAFLGSQPNLRLGGVLLVIVPLLIVSPWVIPQGLLERKAASPFFNQHRHLITGDTVVVASGKIVRAVNWYLKRDDVYLLDRHELEYGLLYPEASGRLLDPQAFVELLEQKRTHYPVAIFCKKHCLAIEQRLPPNAREYSYGIIKMWYVPR